MDEKQYKVGKQILREHDLEFTVEYEGEVFTLRHPTPLIKSQVEAEIARRLGGMSRDAYSPEHLAMVEATTYVNAIVVPDKSPSWFESAWTCYDDRLIAVLYEGYLQFRDNFRRGLREGRFSENRAGGGT